MPTTADLATLASTLEADPDYRVLRRLAPRPRFHEPLPDKGAVRVGAVLDIETTGLNKDGDKIIELAIQRFRFDTEGRIVEVGQCRTWREDPGFPLPDEITKLTGLTDTDLADQAIVDGDVVKLLGPVDVVIAHNASFDRPFVERRLPALAGKAWACSMRDMDWLDLGFDGQGLSHLVMQCGYFYDAHRAENDCLALLYLLSHGLKGGGTVLGRLIERAEQPTWRINAIDAPFDSKDWLKGRGYRWDPVLRFWWREVRDRDLEAEKAWLASAVYIVGGEPKLQEISWRERHG